MVAPNWTPITTTLGQLKPWAANPKYSTKAQAKRILDSFGKFGQVQTVAVGPEFEVYDGHQRLSALLTLHGPEYKIDARQSDRPLTDDERKALVVALHAGAVGSWDWDALKGWDAGQLAEWGMDKDALKGWQEDVKALGGMLQDAQTGDADAEPQVDRAAELKEKWKTERGQLWAIGEHRLLCGDSTSADDVGRVMGGEKADLWFADPPYNAGVDEWDKDFVWAHDWILEFSRFAIVTPGISELVNFCKLTNMPYKWTLAAYISNGFARSAVGFGWWVLGALFSSESVFKQKPDAISIALVVGEADTPARHRGQKPPKFMEWVIGLYGESVVLDTFAGSGTTLVACQNLQRRCRAIEISPAYTAVILERMATAFPGIDIHQVQP